MAFNNGQHFLPPESMYMPTMQGQGNYNTQPGVFVPPYIEAPQPRLPHPGNVMSFPTASSYQSSTNFQSSANFQSSTGFPNSVRFPLSSTDMNFPGPPSSLSFPGSPNMNFPGSVPNMSFPSAPNVAPTYIGQPTSLQQFPGMPPSSLPQNPSYTAPAIAPLSAPSSASQLSNSPNQPPSFQNRLISVKQEVLSDRGEVGSNLQAPHQPAPILQAPHPTASSQKAPHHSAFKGPPPLIKASQLKPLDPVQPSSLPDVKPNINQLNFPSQHMPTASSAYSSSVHSDTGDRRQVSEPDIRRHETVSAPSVRHTQHDHRPSVAPNVRPPGSFSATNNSLVRSHGPPQSAIGRPCEPVQEQPTVRPYLPSAVPYLRLQPPVSAPNIRHPVPTVPPSARHYGPGPGFVPDIRPRKPVAAPPSRPTEPQMHHRSHTAPRPNHRQQQMAPNSQIFHDSRRLPKPGADSRAFDYHPSQTPTKTFSTAAKFSLFELMEMLDQGKLSRFLMTNFSPHSPDCERAHIMYEVSRYFQVKGIEAGIPDEFYKHLLSPMVSASEVQQLKDKISEILKVRSAFNPTSADSSKSSNKNKVVDSSLKANFGWQTEKIDLNTFGNFSEPDKGEKSSEKGKALSEEEMIKRAFTLRKDPVTVPTSSRQLSSKPTQNLPLHHAANVAPKPTPKIPQQRPAPTSGQMSMGPNFGQLSAPGNPSLHILQGMVNTAGNLQQQSMAAHHQQYGTLTTSSHAHLHGAIHNPGLSNYPQGYPQLQAMPSKAAHPHIHPALSHPSRQHPHLQPPELHRPGLERSREQPGLERSREQPGLERARQMVSSMNESNRSQRPGANSTSQQQNHNQIRIQPLLKNVKQERPDSPQGLVPSNPNLQHSGQPVSHGPRLANASRLPNPPGSANKPIRPAVTQVPGTAGSAGFQRPPAVPSSPSQQQQRPEVPQTKVNTTSHEHIRIQPLLAKVKQERFENPDPPTSVAKESYSQQPTNTRPTVSISAQPYVSAMGQLSQQGPQVTLNSQAHQQPTLSTAGPQVSQAVAVNQQQRPEVPQAKLNTTNHEHIRIQPLLAKVKQERFENPSSPTSVATESGSQANKQPTVSIASQQVSQAVAINAWQPQQVLGNTLGQQILGNTLGNLVPPMINNTSNQPGLNQLVLASNSGQQVLGPTIVQPIPQVVGSTPGLPVQQIPNMVTNTTGQPVLQMLGNTTGQQPILPALTNSSGQRFQVPQAFTNDHLQQLSQVTLNVPYLQPIAANFSVNQQPIAANFSVNQQPIAANVSVNQQPISANLSVNQQPIAANFSVNQQPIAANVSINQQPIAANFSVNQQPNAANVSINQQPIAANFSVNQQPIAANLSVNNQAVGMNVSVIKQTEAAKKVPIRRFKQHDPLKVKKGKKLKAKAKELQRKKPGKIPKKMQETVADLLGKGYLSRGRKKPNSSLQGDNIDLTTEDEKHSEKVSNDLLTTIDSLNVKPSENECYLCTFVATDEEKLWDHVLSMHMSRDRGIVAKTGEAEGKYFCSHCTTEFDSYSDVFTHEWETHMSPCPCFFCGLSSHGNIIDNTSEYWNHVFNKHCVVYLCGECGISFSTLSALQDHKMKTPHRQLEGDAQVKYIRCPYCSLKFTTQYAVVRHMIWAHSICPPSGLTCHACNKCFLSQAALDFHSSAACTDADKAPEVTHDSLLSLTKKHIEQREINKLYSAHFLQARRRKIMAVLGLKATTEHVSSSQNLAESEDSMPHTANSDLRPVHFKDMTFYYNIKEVASFCAIDDGQVPAHLFTEIMDMIVATAWREYEHLSLVKPYDVTQLLSMCMCVSRTPVVEDYLKTRDIPVFVMSDSVLSTMDQFSDLVNKWREEKLEIGECKFDRRLKGKKKGSPSKQATGRFIRILPRLDPPVSLFSKYKMKANGKLEKMKSPVGRPLAKKPIPDPTNVKLVSDAGGNGTNVDGEKPSHSKTWSVGPPIRGQKRQKRARRGRPPKREREILPKSEITSTDADLRERKGLPSVNAGNSDTDYYASDDDNFSRLLEHSNRDQSGQFGEGYNEAKDITERNLSATRGRRKGRRRGRKRKRSESHYSSGNEYSPIKRGKIELNDKHRRWCLLTKSEIVANTYTVHSERVCNRILQNYTYLMYYTDKRIKCCYVKLNKLCPKQYPATVESGPADSNSFKTVTEDSEVLKSEASTDAVKMETMDMLRARLAGQDEKSSVTSDTVKVGSEMVSGSTTGAEGRDSKGNIGEKSSETMVATHDTSVTTHDTAVNRLNASNVSLNTSDMSFNISDTSLISLNVSDVTVNFSNSSYNTVETTTNNTGVISHTSDAKANSADAKVNSTDAKVNSGVKTSFEDTNNAKDTLEQGNIDAAKDRIVNVEDNDNDYEISEPRNVERESVEWRNSSPMETNDSDIRMKTENSNLMENSNPMVECGRSIRMLTKEDGTPMESNSSSNSPSTDSRTDEGEEESYSEVEVKIETDDVDYSELEARDHEVSAEGEVADMGREGSQGSDVKSEMCCERTLNYDTNGDPVDADVGSGMVDKLTSEIKSERDSVHNNDKDGTAVGGTVSPKADVNFPSLTSVVTSSTGGAQQYCSEGQRIQTYTTPPTHLLVPASQLSSSTIIGKQQVVETLAGKQVLIPINDPHAVASTQVQNTMQAQTPVQAPTQIQVHNPLQSQIQVHNPTHPTVQVHTPSQQLQVHNPAQQQVGFQVHNPLQGQIQVHTTAQPQIQVHNPMQMQPQQVIQVHNPTQQVQVQNTAPPQVQFQVCNPVQTQSQLQVHNPVQLQAPIQVLNPIQVQPQIQANNPISVQNPQIQMQPQIQNPLSLQNPPLPVQRPAKENSPAATVRQRRILPAVPGGPGHPVIVKNAPL